MVKRMSIVGTNFCQIHFVDVYGNHEDGFSMLEFLRRGDGVHLWQYSGVDSTGGIDVNIDGYVYLENEP